MMKRLISVLLICVLAIGLCACGDLSSIELPPLPTVTPETAEPTPEPTAEPTQQPQEESAETAIITVEHITETAYDPQNGSRLILTYTYDKPSVYIEGKEAVTAKINESLALFEETHYTGNDYGYGTLGISYNDMLTYAEDNFSVMVENLLEDTGMENTADCSVSIERNDGTVLTVLYDTYAYVGGNQSNYSTRGYSYDMSTGEILTLADLVAEDSADSSGSDVISNVDALETYLVSYMVNNFSSAVNGEQSVVNYGEEYSAMADVFGALLRQGSWYFDNDGMVIFSDLDELSDYSSEPIYFNVPYSELESYIDTKWISADIDGTGTITAVVQDGMTDGSTAIIDKLTVDTDGEQIYLVAQGTVRNVEVTVGEFANSLYMGSYIDSFYSINNLWYCGSMDDSALQLVATIPEGLPTLQVSYDDSQGHHELYLTHSGEDGSIILSDSVEAVG